MKISFEWITDFINIKASKPKIIEEKRVQLKDFEHHHSMHIFRDIFFFDVVTGQYKQIHFSFSFCLTLDIAKNLNKEDTSYKVTILSKDKVLNVNIQ